MDRVRRLQAFIKSSTIRKRVFDLVLSANEFVSPIEISRRSKLSVSLVTRALGQLEKEGLVENLTPGKPSWKLYAPTELAGSLFE